MRSLELTIGSGRSSSLSDTTNTPPAAADLWKFTPDESPANPWDEYWQHRQQRIQQQQQQQQQERQQQQQDKQERQQQHQQEHERQQLQSQQFSGHFQVSKLNLSASGTVPKVTEISRSSPPLSPSPSSSATFPGSVAAGEEDSFPMELKMLLRMGYPMGEAVYALHWAQMDLNRAINLLHQKQAFMQKMTEAQQQQQPEMQHQLRAAAGSAGGGVSGSGSTIGGTIPKLSINFCQLLLEIKKCALDGFLDMELVEQPISNQALVLVYQVVSLVKVSGLCAGVGV